MEKFFCETKKVLVIMVVLLAISVFIAPISNAAVKVTGVTLNKEEITLYLNEGKKYDLNETVKPTNATNKKVTWSSSNEKVATVDKKGNVKGIKVGNATITVTTEDGKKTAKCKVKVTNLKISESKLTLNVGNTKKLSVVSELNNKTRTVKWTTSNSKVATIDSDGNVKGIKAGSATITGTVSGIKLTCKVTVSNVKVKSVKLSNTTLTLQEGKSETLKATIEPFNATEQGITWSTSNKKVATVDNGKVTAKGTGTATITVKTKDGSKKATCKVTVVADPNKMPPIGRIPVTGVLLNKTEVTLYTNKGATYDLGKQLVVQPVTATNKNVKWKTSNSSIVTVDQNGNIKGQKVGTATITVTSSENSKLKATCTVKVTKLTISETKATIGINETKKLKVVSELNKINRTLAWVSDNPAVATVDEKGNVKGISEGEATIRGTTSNDIALECKITVKRIAVKGITLNKTKDVKMAEGKTGTLKATVTPSNATNKKIKWTSSNEKIATVDSNGKVTAKKFGKVTIKAISEENSKIVASVNIKVLQKVTSLSIDGESELEVYKGWEKKMKVICKPTEDTDTSVEWESTNTKVATVDSNGVVKAVGVGTAEIRVKATSNPKATDAIKLVVSDKYYKYGGNVYKLAVSSEKLDKVVNKISSAGINQRVYKQVWSSYYGKYVWVRLSGKCAAVSNYYIKMLYGKISVESASWSGARNEGNGYVGNPITSLSTLKKAIDNGVLTRVHLRNSSSQHWAVAIGYKVNGNGSAYDLLFLDPYNGNIVGLGSSICTRLYNGTLKARMIYQSDVNKVY